MAWGAERQTTRQEDRAYCLLGLFNVNMPLLYGERGNAFLRLEEEIKRSRRRARSASRSRERRRTYLRDGSRKLRSRDHSRLDRSRSRRRNTRSGAKSKSPSASLYRRPGVSSVRRVSSRDELQRSARLRHRRDEFYEGSRDTSSRRSRSGTRSLIRSSQHSWVVDTDSRETGSRRSRSATRTQTRGSRQCWLVETDADDGYESEYIGDRRQERTTRTQPLPARGSRAQQTHWQRLEGDTPPGPERYIRDADRDWIREWTNVQRDWANSNRDWGRATARDTT
jgi:hypothetical protein